MIYSLEVKFCVFNSHSIFNKMRDIPTRKLVFLCTMAALCIQVKGCPTEGVGCAKHLPACCAGLTCVYTTSDFGFCQPDQNATTDAITTSTASIQANGVTTEPPVTTLHCQADRTGCSQQLPCCAGLVCAIDHGQTWGYCEEVTPPPLMVATPEIPSNAMVTKEEFIKAVTSNGFKAPTDAQYANFIARAGPSGRIETKRELAMFLANILHESDGLRAKREYMAPAGWYVYPKYDMPGQTYYGRGYIQLSWSYNYRAASLALYADERLLKDPDMVARNETVNWDVSFWFWAANVHDKPGVKDGQFGATILAINGELECGDKPKNTDGPKKRVEFYRRVLVAFGLTERANTKGCFTFNNGPMDIS